MDPCSLFFFHNVLINTFLRLFRVIKINKKIKAYVDFIGDVMLIDETYDDLLFRKLKTANRWQKGVV